MYASSKYYAIFINPKMHFMAKLPSLIIVLIIGDVIHNFTTAPITLCVIYITQFAEGKLKLEPDRYSRRETQTTTGSIQPEGLVEIN